MIWLRTQKLSGVTIHFNPWIGCTKVSDGCRNCYAENLMDTRYHKTKWGPNGLRVIKAESGWREPLKWNRDAEAAGERRRVFCASLADVGEGPETMPEGSWIDVQAARTRLSHIIMNCTHLQFLLLTKRPENMTKYFDRVVLERCWVGTSIEDSNQWERIVNLEHCPASVRFLSCEPLLEKVNLDLMVPCSACNHSGNIIMTMDEKGRCSTCSGQRFTPRQIHWCIVGSESGSKRRPMQTDWARSIRAQCRAAGIAFFMKQMDVGGKVSGELSDFPDDLRVREFPEVRQPTIARRRCGI